MKITARQIAEGERIPRGFGIAYWNYEYRTAVAYPIPLHLLVRLGRIVYHWVRVAAWERDLSRAFGAGYSRGYEAGRHELFQHGLRDYMQNIDTAEAEYFKRTLK